MCIITLATFGFRSEGADGWQVLALAVVVALASFWVAGIVGFIFGVAPFADNGSDKRQPLVEISDWLTKILVGVGLVEIRALGSALRGAGEYVAHATRLRGGSQLFSAYLVVEAACGFWFMYFWTSMRWADLTASAKRTPDVATAERRNPDDDSRTAP